MQLLIGSIEQSHNGTYVCVASNPAGTMGIEVKVTVLGGFGWVENSIYAQKLDNIYFIVILFSIKICSNSGKNHSQRDTI